MDAEHSAHLQRILENRRKRGAYTSQPPPSPSEGRGYSAASAAPLPSQAAAPDPLAATARPGPSAPAAAAAAAAAPATSQTAPVYTQQRPPPPQTQAVQVQQSPVAPPPAVLEAELRALLDQNKRLQQNQLLQDKRIEALQAELRGGFSGINHTLRAALTPLRQQQEERRPDPREKSRAAGLAHASQLLEREGALSGRRYPVPAQLGDVAGPAPHAVVDSGPLLVPFRAPGSAFGGTPRAGATELPRKPPISARPFTTSTIDIDSSVTILRSGNWWLKWNRKGTEVNPRFVWLDTEKYILSWGKQRGAPSLLSGHINVEQIHGVTTSQMVEYEDDVARVFFVLIIHTPTRQVYLATEKREKLDTWFDALNNLAMFYRSHGVLMREEAPSTE